MTPECEHPTNRVRYNVFTNSAMTSVSAYCMACNTKIDPNPVKVPLDGATLLLYPHGLVRWE